MPRLEPLKQLRLLRLELNPVTDEGLRCLDGLPKLRHVYLAGTRTTPRGRDAWRARSPGLVIHE
jgi:hypothetical protein